ncbi:MAG: amino acid adenylation domain-containing protein [Actinomycetota bacterium]|nr:amino acid adenylation domain-containing protein [Actinomycetota bacterium]
MMEETANVFQGSPQQDEQWRREPHGPRGRVQAVVSFEGPLDPAALRAALRRVADRHEILRTTFAHSPGIAIPLQVIADELEPTLETREPSPAAGDMTQILASERSAPIDFEQGPLVRGLLLSFAPDRHALAITLSSLCADASSMPVLVADLAHHMGADVAPANDPLQYADFAAWQAELSEADDASSRAARDTWAKLDGASSPQLPLVRGAFDAAGFEEVSIELPAGVSSGLLQAAWHALLARLSGEQRVVTSYLSPNRRHADLEGAIGAFARPVPIAADVDLEAPLNPVAAQIEEGRRRAPELQDYAPAGPGDMLTVGYYDFDRFQGQAGSLSISLARVVSTADAWRLSLSCERSDAARTAWIAFDPVSHDRELVNRLARELRCMIAHLVAERDTPIGALELLDGDEREQVLEGFGRGPAAAPATRIPTLIAKHAAAAPESPAVLDGERSLSYGELDARANQLAHHLRDAGAGPGAPVGLCMDRTTEMIVGLVGILKAGAAYIPLNYDHPPARLAQQLSAAGARAIVTQDDLRERLPDFDAEIVCVDHETDLASLRAAPTSAPDIELSDEDLAYVIYTSGSTGQPKGVAVTHGNLAGYVADITTRLGANQAPLSFGAVTAISTDLGNTSVFGALGSGGTLVLVSPERSADAAALAAQLEQTPVDVLKITPSHLGALLSAADPRVLPRSTLVLGGERAPWDLVERVRALSDCAILNHYGPTETTVGCCTFRVADAPGPYAPATVPIGRPITGASCYVLDARMQPVPVGVSGTLYVGGAGVARGYVGQPELTAEVFVADPFAATEARNASNGASPRTATGKAARIYNTGDVVRWLPDGALEFLGRADEQVKIRGYRVEPAEVETILRRDPRVAEAVVLAPQGPAGERRLVAYYTGHDEASQNDLRAQLAEQLPEFMIPSAIIKLDAMPRTASGKIDRRSLPDPDSVAAAPSTAYAAPSSPTEIAIAAIFAHTLGVQRVGRDDDFFELGGHSLLATQVVAQIRSELAVDLPLHALFTSPTVAMLAAEVLALMGASDTEETSELLAELESLSDEEVQKLLAGEPGRPDGEH